jgi:hypothetical protein
MLKSVFDQVCNQIMTLVEKQIDEVQSKGSRAKVRLYAKHSDELTNNLMLGNFVGRRFRCQHVLTQPT